MKEYDFKNPKTHVVLNDDHLLLIRGDNDMKIHKSMRGETRIPYKNILGIKFKNPTLTGKGFLEFTLPQTSFIGAARAVQHKNAIFFKRDKLEEVLEIKGYVEGKL